MMEYPSSPSKRWGYMAWFGCVAFVAILTILGLAIAITVHVFQPAAAPVPTHPHKPHMPSPHSPTPHPMPSPHSPTPHPMPSPPVMLSNGLVDNAVPEHNDCHEQSCMFTRLRTDGRCFRHPLEEGTLCTDKCLRRGDAGTCSATGTCEASPSACAGYCDSAVFSAEAGKRDCPRLVDGADVMTGCVADACIYALPSSPAVGEMDCLRMLRDPELPACIRASYLPEHHICTFQFACSPMELSKAERIGQSFTWDVATPLAKISPSAMARIYLPTTAAQSDRTYLQKSWAVLLAPLLHDAPIVTSPEQVQQQQQPQNVPKSTEPVAGNHEAADLEALLDTMRKQAGLKN